jgi:type I restriction enzyme S subunit
MSFPRYPEYKNSGVEWLGKVPAHWEIAAVKRLFHIIGGSTPASDVSRFWDGDVLWATPADLSGSGLELQSTLRTITEAGVASCGTTVAPVGSIILSTRAPIGSLAIAARPMCTNQGCKTLVPGSLASSRYFAYVLSVASPELNLRGRGSTFLELSGDELGRFAVVCPPVREQHIISRFLDHETAKIDALVAEQERLIALLKEKRQAVISHAVTKGLNPAASMKHSGSAWLGQVPANWGVARLRYVSPQLTVGIVVEPSKYYNDQGVPALRSLNIRPGKIMLNNLVYLSEESNELLGKSRLNAGDIVAVRTGQPGTAAVIPQELDGCNCIDLIIIRRPSVGSSEYLCRYLESDSAVAQFADGSGGAIQQHFNVSAAQDLVVPVPPPEEQLAISEFVLNQVEDIDKLIEEVQRGKELLLLRRGALITAAVTGQIDVRGLASAEAA